MWHRKNHEPKGLLRFILWGVSLERPGDKGPEQLRNLIFFIFTFSAPVHIMGLGVLPDECSLSCIDFQEAHEEMKSSVEEGWVALLLVLHRPSGSVLIPGDRTMPIS